AVVRHQAGGPVLPHARGGGPDVDLPGELAGRRGDDGQVFRQEQGEEVEPRGLRPRRAATVLGGIREAHAARPTKNLRYPPSGNATATLWSGACDATSRAWTRRPASFAAAATTRSSSTASMSWEQLAVHRIPSGASAWSASWLSRR